MLVGTLADGATATVDGTGRIGPDGAGWQLDWWIGADDRWHDPSVEHAVRRHQVDDAPVARTVMRVPGGDVVQSVYAVAGTAGPSTVVEVENASAVPFVVALVVRGARRLAVEDGAVVVDGRWVLAGSVPPARWALAAAGTAEVDAIVRSGSASSAPFVPSRARRTGLDGAFLFPVTHRTSRRFTLDSAVAPRSTGARSSLDDVVRGWNVWADRGLRVTLPDDRLLASVRSALVQAALGAQRTPDARTVAALEDWGFDDEARRGWERLSIRERRAARRRSAAPRWSSVRDDGADGGPALLLALRALLVSVSDAGVAEHDGGEGVVADRATVTLLSELPSTWRGQSLDVHGAPTPYGPVSFALRWHGSRPALLWEVPEGVRVVAPGLDPLWSSTEPRGEALVHFDEAEIIAT